MTLCLVLKGIWTAEFIGCASVCPTICGKSSVSGRKQRSLGMRAKRRHTVALSEVETDDQSFRKVLILIGRSLMLYYFPVIFDLFERIADGVIDFYF